MSLPSLPVLKAILRELATSERSPRVPEPDLVMDDPAKVAAYVVAAGEDGARSSVYLYHAAQICELLRPGDLVVDLACGPANQLAIVARLNPDVRFVGVDLSDRMLGIARRSIDEMGLRNVTLRHGDITRLADFDDRSVDSVISTVALHHLPTVGDLERTFAEVARVLKPGGGLYLLDFGHLKSEKTIHYFAYQYAYMQPELFVLDYLYSLRAAFRKHEYRNAWAKHLSGHGRFYASYPVPFMVTVKSPARRALPRIFSRSSSRAGASFRPRASGISRTSSWSSKAGGLPVPGLDEPVRGRFSLGLRSRGRLYAPDPRFFLAGAPAAVPSRPVSGAAASRAARLDALVGAALRAPSGSNTQPWRFAVEDGTGHVRVWVDESADPSAMNAGQRMSRIAVGAAVENLLRTAERNGWSAELEAAPPGMAAAIRVRGLEAGEAGSDAILAGRVTNRRPYDGSPVAPELRSRLGAATAPLDGVATHWITERRRVEELAALVGRAETMMFGETSLRLSLLSKIRFDAAAGVPVEEGLPVSSLELTPTQRLALRFSLSLPGPIVRRGGVAALAGARARALARSASGFCLVVAPDDAAATDVVVGRAAERAWLALAGEGLAAHPMMSALVLESILTHGARELGPLGRGNVEALRDALRGALPEIGAGRPGFLMRFGRAEAPTERTGRLPLETVAAHAAPPAAGEKRRKKVLFIAEAVTLSTVVRPATLARALDPGRYDVLFAMAPRFGRLLPDLPFPVRALASVGPESFLEKLAAGSPLYRTETLREYVKEDLEVIRSFSPDVVVGDFRLSLSISARLAGVPYLAITDSCWSPYAREALVLGENPMRRVIGPGAASIVFRLLKPVALAYHAHALNRIRREHGLPDLGRDLRHLFTDADHVLYADVPELTPVFGAPPRHHYLGPVLWSPPVPLPVGWDRLPPGLPVIHVSLGSSGRADLLPEILDALEALPVSVVAATAGRVRLARVPRNAIFAEYLPGARVLARAQLSICNGGSPATQQALAAGVPVLGITGNMNQILNMRAVAAAGAGAALHATAATGPAVREAAVRLLSDPAYASAASSLQRTFQRYDTPGRFREIVEGVLTGVTAAA